MEEQSPEMSAGLEAARVAHASADSPAAILEQRFAEVEELRNTATELVNSLQDRLAQIHTAATEAVASCGQIANERAVILTTFADVKSAGEHADAVRGELDRMRNAAAESVAEADSHRTQAKAAFDATAKALEDIRGQKDAAVTEASSARSLREDTQAAFIATKGLSDRSDAIEKRLSEYESALADIHKQSAEQLVTITRLLPGATAAGLANAFRERGQSFLSPVTRWQRLFVGAIACLVLLALTGLFSVYKDNTVLGWDDLARLWIARLPIAGALIWLALHSSREAALAKRLEEDYGYKAAIAASFLGFQNQMAEIGENASAGSPLSQLCQDTLATIGSPPGRIYEKHRLTTTPAGELAEAAVSAAGGLTQVSPHAGE